MGVSGRAGMLLEMGSHPLSVVFIVVPLQVDVKENSTGFGHYRLRAVR